ncbi:MAG: 4-hydroxybenzoate octaprenyltransferase [Proteobacteria bacterium]|nr:4-hydroxybenzoate octaprenyltransferase [Pseudomonadota bacterium]
MQMLSKLMIYLRLARLDKPVGIYLLLWPSLIGLMLGGLNEGYIDFENYLIVLAGAILARSCGCVINDISDHKFDKLVSRTKDRPIAKGEVSLKGAWIFFYILASSCLSLLMFVPKTTVQISLVIAVFILIYPLTKRFLKAPQFFLGITFGSGTLISYSLASPNFSISIMILFLGAVLWIISFDTIYALEDIDDDKVIGINSTPILWEDKAIIISKILHLLFYFSLFLIFYVNQFTLLFLAILFILLCIFLYQYSLVDERKYLKAFKINHWVGMFAAIGFAVEIFLI